MKPRCPYCNVVGWKNIQAKNLNDKIIIFYCGSCSAIHGVAPATKRKQTQADIGKLHEAKKATMQQRMMTAKDIEVI
jgi:hypothetical protein